MKTGEDVRILLGRNVKRFRKQKGLSQEQLAEKVGISVKHLSTIESGAAFLSSDLLQALSDTLDVPVYLLFYEGPLLGTYGSEKKKQIESIIDSHVSKAADSLKQLISEIL